MAYPAYLIYQGSVVVAASLLWKLHTLDAACNIAECCMPLEHNKTCPAAVQANYKQ